MTNRFKRRYTDRLTRQGEVPCRTSFTSSTRREGFSLERFCRQAGRVPLVRPRGTEFPSLRGPTDCLPDFNRPSGAGGPLSAQPGELPPFPRHHRSPGHHRSDHGFQHQLEYPFLCSQRNPAHPGGGVSCRRRPRSAARPRLQGDGGLSPSRGQSGDPVLDCRPLPGSRHLSPRRPAGGPGPVIRARQAAGLLPGRRCDPGGGHLSPGNFSHLFSAGSRSDPL